MATDIQILNEFSEKLSYVKNNLTVLKASVISQTDVSNQALAQEMINRCAEMLNDTTKLQEIEAKYRNASQVWLY
jgi:hypothetical protein